MSSLLGLNAAPRTATRLPIRVPPHSCAGEVDHAGAAAQVDLVDLAQERQGLVGAELAGAGHERADVLGQAAAAEADAGVEELAPDPVVVADRVGELGHVGAGGLADLGHGVDERDLGGQERVGGGLDQLGGGVVGDQARRAGGQRRGVHLVQQGGVGLGGRPGDAVHEPVRGHGVLDGEALAQELGVPGQADLRAGGRARLQQLAQPDGGADRHGGLAHDQRVGGQVRGQRGAGGEDVGGVGGVLAAALRGAHAEEVHARRGDLGVVGGEPQPAGGQHPGQQVVQAGLEQRRLAGVERRRPWPGRRRRRRRCDRGRPCRPRGRRRGSRCR